MGSGISGFSVNNTPGQTQEALTLSLQLGYTRADVNRLYRAFRKMDTCKTGSISLRSYCTVNKISTAFGELIFRRMLRLGNDVDRDLTFKDYLLSSWNALSIFDNDSISTLTFQIFDVDDSCIMTVEEVRHMIEVIYRESDQKNLTVLNVLIDNIGKCETVSIDDFVVLVRNLPSLLYPVFDLIKAVRQRTLGEKRWIEISKLRMLPLANKFVFMNKVNSGNISLSKLNTRVKSSSNLHQRNGSFNSVSSASRNGNLRYSFTGGELQSASEGSINGGNLTARSNNREDDSSSSSNLYPKQIRRRNSANGSDVSASPSKLRAQSFSAMGNGSMGAQSQSHHNASSSAIAYNASNPRRNGSAVQRVSHHGAPRDYDSQKSNSGSSSAADSTPKNNLDAIKVANALHLDRMKRANSQNLNKLIEANSNLDAYKKKSVHLQDTAQSNSSDSSSPDISEVTARKVESKSGHREGVFTSARRFSK